MAIFEFDKVFNPEDYFYIYSPMITIERSLLQADFIIQALELVKGVKVLDLCCGHGRISNLLAERGYAIVGLDASNSFLKIAREEAKKLRLKITYLQGDMRKIPFKEEFDAIINIFTSFGYFSDEENSKVLKGVSKALKPEGKFLIDVVNRDWVLKNFLPYIASPRGEDYVVEINTFDALTSINLTERILFKEGKVKKTKFFVRMYTYTELKYLLSQVGLRVIASYGGFKMEEPFSLDSRRMILISQKE